MSIHAWGMTETSPVAVASHPTHNQARLPPADRAWRSAASRAGRCSGVELRAVGPAGEDVARDGEAFGAMLVRGPCVAARYYGSEDDDAFATPGWFATGDVVTVDPEGFVEIVDRAKDVIKSGGEWISSIELENIAVEHPAVREAAVVARVDPRWGERPVLFVVVAEGLAFDDGAMATLFQGRVARWMVPTELRVVPVLPHTATGKLHKAAIRQML